MIRILAILLALTTSAFAQTGTSVQQGGNITPGHAVEWLTDGVVGDGGTPAAGNFTGLGVTFSGSGICQNSGPITGAFNRLCFNVTSTGGGFSLYNYNGATGGLTVNVNGANSSLATVMLPTTASTPGCFTGTGGTLQNCTVTGTDKVVFSTSPTIASPTITGAFTATGLVTNADLVNPTIVVNSTNCTLGSSCTILATAVLTVGSSPISSGSSGCVLFDNASNTLSCDAGFTYAGASGAVALAGALTVTGLLTPNGNISAPTIAGELIISNAINGGNSLYENDSYAGAINWYLRNASSNSAAKSTITLLNDNGNSGVITLCSSGNNTAPCTGNDDFTFVSSGNMTLSAGSTNSVVLRNNGITSINGLNLTLKSYTYSGQPSPVVGEMAYFSDGLAANCGDSTCTTFGTTVAGGGGSLKLLVWYNGSNWTLIGK